MYHAAPAMEDEDILSVKEQEVLKEYKDHIPRHGCRQFLRAFFLHNIALQARVPKTYVGQQRLIVRNCETRQGRTHGWTDGNVYCPELYEELTKPYVVC